MDNPWIYPWIYPWYIHGYIHGISMDISMDIPWFILIGGPWGVYINYGDPGGYIKWGTRGGYLFKELPINRHAGYYVIHGLPIYLYTWFTYLY